jgi:hypothetical protein
LYYGTFASQGCRLLRRLFMKENPTQNNEVNTTKTATYHCSLFKQFLCKKQVTGHEVSLAPHLSRNHLHPPWQTINPWQENTYPLILSSSPPTESTHDPRESHGPWRRSPVTQISRTKATDLEHQNTEPDGIESSLIFAPRSSS